MRGRNRFDAIERVNVPPPIVLADVVEKIERGEEPRMSELTSLRASVWAATNYDTSRLPWDPKVLAKRWRECGEPDQSGEPTKTTTNEHSAVSGTTEDNEHPDD